MLNLFAQWLNGNSRHTRRMKRIAPKLGDIQVLETRSMLTAISVFDDGILSIDVDDDSPVTVSVENGNVLVNDLAPRNADVPSDPVAASDVLSIIFNANGDFNNLIDLSAVTSVDFTNFQSSSINAGGGLDEITGTDFADVIVAGLGNDIVQAGGGDDTVLAVGGNNTIDGGAGNDILIGAAGNRVTEQLARCQLSSNL